MSKKIDVLKSFAVDFSNALGVSCKLVGESGMYAIGKEVGNHGAVETLTQHYDADTLYKVCIDFLKAMNLKKTDDTPTSCMDRANLVNSKVAVATWDAPQYVGPVVRGAQCLIRYQDGQQTDGYISFDQEFDVDAEAEFDVFGVPDVNIFYVAERGEVEVKEMMAEGANEFRVLSYELRYVNEAEPQYETEITDHRKTSGQLYVDMASISGDIDDMLSATFEINRIPGTNIETQCMHLSFDGNDHAVAIYKKGDSYIIQPEQGVSINSIQLHDGAMGYELS